MTFASKGRGERWGSAHIAARKAAAAVHHPSHPCARCGKPLGPMGPGLHYDHAESGGYLGFAHARCNVNAGASKGARIANAKRKAKRRPPFERPTR